tara:strand:- start:349 stop:1305 length:957 start_codon:yes stop_codon:yes gene_type:complete
MIVYPNCLTSYAHVIKVLGLTTSFSGTNDPDVIRMAINSISDNVERAMGRPLKYDVVTDEKHDSNGKEWCFADRYPILSLDDFYDDPQGTFGSDTQLTVADKEIEVYKNNDTQTVPNMGIVRRLDANFSRGQRNLKVDYKGGFSEFWITEANNKFDCDFGSGSIAVSLTNGKYTAITLPTHIDARLEAAAGTTTEFTVAYDEVSHTITMTKAAGTFSLLWTGTNSVKGAEFADMIGFDSEADQTGALTYTSPNPIIGLPFGLEKAVLDWIVWDYTRDKQHWSGVISEQRSDQSWGLDFDRIPVHILKRLNYYNRRKVA